MSNIFRKIFDAKKVINPVYKKAVKQDKIEIKMNLKGQRVNYDNEGASMIPDSDSAPRDKGPPMLNMKTRVKVWSALFLVGVYFYLCYRLIIFRLKSDDLDLMEREVNDEFKLKTKIKELNK
jgi:hypothetical protein